ncbi:RagB/SusD family nutrient uptake outer membrane protein [Muribaculum intestinale]|uniref:RagB/SusD family nutrient uptake outer membrane protein n=1 Tax=Muribaculum intestinale TaxID=1796646 RepID=UPI0025A985F4|nr:RagB/SusD family nutrient uptake outer membrane protein [Muribaculum intestinale]
MNRKIIYILMIAVGLFVTSCDDFLDERPQSVASAANFYKSDSDIENAVNACYATLQMSQLYRDFMITMTETRSDNVEDQNPGGNAGRDYNIDKFAAGADNAAITSMWQYSYNAIMRCNAVLDNIGVCTNASLKQRYEGEARFLRGLMYFNLVRFYGAVPIVRTQISVSQAIASSRDEVNSVYGFIEEDFKAASALLPKQYPDSEKGRATSGAALGMLAKVYLTQARWSDCVTIIERLLSAEYSGVYKLLPDVADVFKSDNKLNEELMFVVHYSKSIVGEGHGFNQYFGNASFLDVNLRNGYEADDARKGLLEPVVIDKTTTPFVKFYDTFDPTTKNVGYDQAILRYADVLLMYAEALNEIRFDASSSSKALEYLNMVRDRSGATMYLSTDFASQDAFRSAVLLERRLEFPLEMHRWFDLIRTNTAEEAMAKVGMNITKDDYLYPIPKSEMELCPNFYQNPGYSDK